MEERIWVEELVGEPRMMARARAGRVWRRGRARGECRKVRTWDLRVGRRPLVGGGGGALGPEVRSLREEEGGSGRSFWVMRWRTWEEVARGSLGVPGVGDWPKDLAMPPTIASVFSEGVDGLGGWMRMFSWRMGGVRRGRVSMWIGGFKVAGGQIRVWMADNWERQMLRIWVQRAPVGRSMSVNMLVRRGHGWAQICRISQRAKV